MTDTMNDMNDDTRRGYDQYMLEVMQLEWEQAEALRRARLEWVEDSLREALADYDHMMSSDQPQAQHDMSEHTPANASQVVADGRMPDVTHAVKPLGRPVTYKTGVRSMGYEEESSTMLCWKCDAEAEYAGYCEPHYDQWLEEQAEAEQPDLMWEEEWDDLMSAEELERVQREQEEGRDDH